MNVWRRTKQALVVLGMTVLFAIPASAQLGVPSDGSDGALSPTSNVEIDLNEAAEAAWDVSPNPTPGKGVYDGQKWAVVFRYSTVNIPTGVRVTFKSRPGYPPVVWLVQGDVTIDGTLSVAAPSGVYDPDNRQLPSPGPGGFRGGKEYKEFPTGGSQEAGAGFGPGGGRRAATGSTGASGGSFATPPTGYPPELAAEPYGNPEIIPLIGGSGGSAKADPPYSGKFGGPGGGAILIATNSEFTLNGVIDARGYSIPWVNGPLETGPGAGGAVRVICDQMNGFAGSFDVRGGLSGDYGVSGQAGGGRVRVESNVFAWLGGVQGATMSTGFPSNPAQIWPPEATPAVKLIEVNGQAVPADPRARMGLNHQDVSLASTGDVTWRVESRRVPLDWAVTLRVNPMAGKELFVACTAEAGGTVDLAYWTCTATMPSGYFTAQVRAKAPDYTP